MLLDVGGVGVSDSGQWCSDLARDRRQVFDGIGSFGAFSGLFCVIVSEFVLQD